MAQNFNIMKGKRGLILGVANDRSIAEIARFFTIMGPIWHSPTRQRHLKNACAHWRSHRVSGDSAMRCGTAR